MTPVQKLEKIAKIIERIDHRAMWVDGPVTPTHKEITANEIKEIYEISSDHLKKGATRRTSKSPRIRRHLRDSDKITVCASCLRACCWQGSFFCDNYREADIIDKTVKELKKLKLEHSDYWKEDLRIKGIIQ